MWLWLWVACAGEGDKPGGWFGGGDTDVEDSGEQNDINPRNIQGTIRILDLELAGTVDIQSAFGAAVGDTFVLYLANSPDATCEQITDYLMPGVKEPVDPSPFLLGGACDMYFRIDRWEGTIDVSDDWILAANAAINCAFGEGAFELGGSGQEEDYFWTGTWWQGAPEAYNFSLTPAGDDYDLTLEMFTYSGRLTQESGAVHTGTGDVVGSITVTSCPALGDTLLR